MNKIKAYVGCNEKHNIHYYRQFDIVDKDYLKDDDIVSYEELKLDSEQGRDEVYNYSYYKVIKLDDESDPYYEYVAIEKEQSYDD